MSFFKPCTYTLTEYRMADCSKTIFFFIFTFFLLSFPAGNSMATIYNVLDFGAKSDGTSDCTGPFLSAWKAACTTPEMATIYVPPGSYLLREAVFTGKSCNSSAISILINGTIVAPIDYSIIGNSKNWMKFQHVTGVSIQGGTLDGRGLALWECKKHSNHCPNGTTTLAFYHSNNITVDALSSLNSQKVHIDIYGCRNASLSNMNISAAGNSPNTDGIHVQQSSAVTILNSSIGTGDDCVSIGPGTSDLWVENILCGPGHGISIGSLGWKEAEAGVKNVTVKNATLTETQNGVRVKTWARPSDGFVRDVTFQNISIVNAKNPIIIDQNYCPHNIDCPRLQDLPGIRISNITYEDVHGTSATKVAVQFNCSKTNPCTGITLNDVSLTYRDGSAATASCTNANGTAIGTVEPTSCLA